MSDDNPPYPGSQSSSAEPVGTARTPEEAHLYQDLDRCPCGGAAGGRSHVLVQLGDDLGARYTGTCDRCGQPRTVLFRLPPGLVPAGPSPDYGPGRSDVIDAGQWRFVADRMSSAAPMRPPADREDRRVAHHRIATAVAAMDQLLRFDQGGVIPEHAFWTEHSLQDYRQNPNRYVTIRQAVVRNAYADVLREYDPADPLVGGEYDPGQPAFGDDVQPKRGWWRRWTKGSQ